MLVKRTLEEKLQSAINELGVPYEPANLGKVRGLIAAALMEVQHGIVDTEPHSFKDLADRARMRRGIKIASILLYNSQGDDEFFQAAQIVLESSIGEYEKD